MKIIPILNCHRTADGPMKSTTGSLMLLRNLGKIGTKSIDMSVPEQAHRLVLMHKSTLTN